MVSSWPPSLCKVWWRMSMVSRSVVGGSRLHTSRVSAMPRWWWVSSTCRARMYAFHACTIHVIELDAGLMRERSLLRAMRETRGRTFKKTVSSPFFIRFSIRFRACFKFCPSMASWICLLRRWKTASVEAMIKGGEIRLTGEMYRRNPDRGIVCCGQAQHTEAGREYGRSG